MTRRTLGFLVTLALGLVVVPLAAAQPVGKVPRIGGLGPRPPAAFVFQLEAFRQGLRELGYLEGQHLVMEYRYAEENLALPALAAELVYLAVDVLVTWTTPAIQAAQQATTTIPIVMAASGDPIRTGFVASLARPGGNITGLTILSAELSAKRLELLPQLVPGLARVAVLWTPANPPSSWSGRRLKRPPAGWACRCNPWRSGVPMILRGPSPRRLRRTPRRSTRPPTPSLLCTAPRSSTWRPGAGSRRASTRGHLWRPGAS